MKEVRKANVIFNKNGNGFTTNKITLPVQWIKDLGFTQEDRTAIIEITENRIMIRKEMTNMILIKNENIKYDYERYDYELESGLLLNSHDWNGEIYTRAYNPEKNEYNNNSFKPINRYEVDNIDISEIEENSTEWDKALEVLGFEEV